MKLATLCYIKKDKKTLMLHRTKKKNDMHKGKWVGLGGKFEAGESPEECVIREVYEESGLILKNPCLKGILTFPKAKGEKYDWRVFVFSANEFEGELIESPEGDLEWIDDIELLSLNLWEGDRISIKWLNRKEFFSAKFIYENDVLVDYNVIFYE